MNFYRYDTAADRFTSIGVHWDDRDRVLDLHYSDPSVSKDWEPPIAFGYEEHRDRPLSDFVTLSNYYPVPVVTQRAWELLKPLIGYCCEVLSVIHPSGQPHYFFIHVMETIDALDTERSTFTRNEVTNRINRIYKYAFKPGLLEGKHIFKLPLESGSDLLVDDEFRKVVEENGLKGLLFQPLPMADD